MVVYLALSVIVGGGSAGAATVSYTETTPGGIDPLETFPKSPDDKKLFQVAFGIVNRRKLDTSLFNLIGNVKAFYKDFDENGNLVYTELTTHACDSTDFEKNFYKPLHKDNKEMIEKI